MSGRHVSPRVRALLDQVDAVLRDHEDPPVRWDHPEVLVAVRTVVETLAQVTEDRAALALALVLVDRSLGDGR